ncbi:hypothetical protein TNCT_448011 [Trichonephila clavata]|uniref:Uncharacterized protein n=1 Tax=Trichonephila clavata TaxID=2740835 RepID=A0A8X6KMA7_TRICU|nr:hypothetical protein TNCT_448011 [Trichonephila clavata]
MELDATSKARCEEELSRNGNKLPDPLDQRTTEHVLVHNKMLGPPITFGDIYMYFVEKECTYTREKMKNYKGLDAFNYVLSGKVDPIQVSAMNFSRKRKGKQKVFKKSKLPSEEAYKTFIEAMKKHQPDAPYLQDLTDDEETSSASETEHQEEHHLPNLIQMIRTKFSGILKYVRPGDAHIRCYWVAHYRVKQSKISNCLQETKHPVQCGITKEREE